MFVFQPKTLKYQNIISSTHLSSRDPSNRGVTSASAPLSTFSTYHSTNKRALVLKLAYWRLQNVVTITGFIVFVAISQANVSHVLVKLDKTINGQSSCFTTYIHYISFFVIDPVKTSYFDQFKARMSVFEFCFQIRSQHWK